MFKFLKEKLNNVVKKFSKDVEEESEKIEVPKDSVELSSPNVHSREREIKEEKKPEPKPEPKQEVKSEPKKEIKKEEKRQSEALSISEKTSEFSGHAKQSLALSDKSEKKEVPKEEVKREKIIEKKQAPIKEIKEEKKKEVVSEKKPADKKPIHIAEKVKNSVELSSPNVQSIEREKVVSIPERKEQIKEKKPEEKIIPVVEKKAEPEKEIKEEVPEKRQSDSLSISDKSEKPKEKKGFFSRLFKKEEVLPEKIVEEPEIEEEIEEEVEEELEEELEQEVEPEIEKAEEEQEEEKEIKEEKKEIRREEIIEEKKRPIEVVKEKEEHKGFFSKITDTFTKINLSEEKFEEIFWDLEVTLLENNVAVEVIQKIKDDLKEELVSEKVSRKTVDEIIEASLKKSIEEVLDVKGINLDEKIKEKKKANQPYIIAVIGVNGSGKTTTIAKLVHKLQKKGYSVVLAAADTFRAAAIQQLEHHADKLGVKMIKHDYNSDPAAVAFDAIKHAEAKKIDVVIIDTAGRLHSNDNLMNELKKLIKVNKPDLKLFVGESITGNDCVEQAKVYDEIIGIDAIILSKADVDEKGGAALSISYVTQKPVLFIGTGQTYDDLKEFNKKEIIESLGL
ncbi:MAG: signal recognition particle-docking protein FtsY [Candidatus Nanoarchaeia archaeon]